MKKSLLTTLALAVGTLLSNAQGTITIGNASTTAYLIETNSAQYVPGTYIPQIGSANARTLSTANSFFYEVLTQGAVGANTAGGAPTGSPTLNPFDASWLDTGVGGKNTTLTRGGITATGNAGGAANAGTWGLPAGSTYDTGSDQWYLIVGWSANLGTTWAAAKAAFPTATTGFFGQSQLGYNVAGGANSLNPVLLWGNGGTGIAGAGLTAGFAMGTVGSVPEPGTFALAGMGLAAMLVSRRRK